MRITFFCCIHHQMNTQSILRIILVLQTLILCVMKGRNNLVHLYSAYVKGATVDFKHPQNSLLLKLSGRPHAGKRNEWKKAYRILKEMRSWSRCFLDFLNTFAAEPFFGGRSPGAKGNSGKIADKDSRPIRFPNGLRPWFGLWLV